MFNIKLAKSGGMFLGSKLFAIAQAANTPCMLGSMIESSLGMLANYHFARAHPMATCGLSAYSYVKDPISVGLRLSGGTLQLDGEYPGLGYPDPAPFERVFQSDGEA
jgi:L-alanine-DL-glutamate epimerase-like enolase superfamily enzyme